MADDLTIKFDDFNITGMKPVTGEEPNILWARRLAENTGALLFASDFGRISNSADTSPYFSQDTDNFFYGKAIPSIASYIVPVRITKISSSNARVTLYIDGVSYGYVDISSSSAGASGTISYVYNTTINKVLQMNLKVTDPGGGNMNYSHISAIVLPDYDNL